MGGGGEQEHWATADREKRKPGHAIMPSSHQAQGRVYIASYVLSYTDTYIFVLPKNIFYLLGEDFTTIFIRLKSMNIP